MYLQYNTVPKYRYMEQKEVVYWEFIFRRPSWQY